MPNKFRLIHVAMRNEFGAPKSLVARFRAQLALFEGEEGGGGTGTPDAAALQKQIDALNAKNQELIGQRRKDAEKYKAYDGIDPEIARKAIEHHTKSEEERARAAGEFDKLKGTLIENHKKELEGVTGKLGKTQGFLFRQMAVGAISAALVGADGQPIGNSTLLSPHLLPFIKVTENPNATGEEDAFIMQVVDANKQARVKDGQGTPFTVADLIAETQKKPEFAQAFFAPNTSGGGSSGNTTGGGDSAGEIVLSKADGRDPIKYRAARDKATKEGKRLRVAEA